MNIARIGEQISHYRKALGFTQEELGRRLGVSTQAVSRWECGGAPDIALLPAIADALQVTVDALFGRAGGEVIDPEEALLRWAQSLPQAAQLSSLTEVMRNVCFRASFTDGTLPPMEALDSAIAHRGQGSCLFLSSLCTEQGYASAVHAKDLQFLAIYPEPEAGYAAYLADMEDYRRLFAALAQPHTLELLLALYREPRRLFTAAAMAKRLGIPAADAEAAMEALGSAGILMRNTVELEDGPHPGWIICMEKPLIPFLLDARYLLQPETLNFMMVISRDRPLLRKERPNEDH